MWKKLTFMFFLGCCCCCNPSKDVKSDTSVVSIDVSEQREDEIGSNDIRLAASVIQLRDSLPIGNILDMALIDSICYFIDSNWNIYGVDLSNGRVCCKYVQHGGAELETLCPVCIAVEGKSVYVYDTGKENVLVLSSQLVPEKIIRISIANPISIRKTKNGFLCLSLIEGKQVIQYYDNDANMSFIKNLSDVKVSLYENGATIQEGTDGYLYVKAMYSDTIFRWKDSMLEPAYVIGYGSKSIPQEMHDIQDIKATEREYTLDYFVFETGVLSSFVNSSNHHLVFNYYNNEEKHSKTGSVNKILKLFFPRWQFGNKILHAFHPEYIQALKETIKQDAGIELNDEGIVIFMYELS